MVGPNEEVIEMLEEIGTVENAAAIWMTVFAINARLWALGHRVYKVKDPAKILQDLAEQMFVRFGAIAIMRSLWSWNGWWRIAWVIRGFMPMWISILGWSIAS